MRIAVIGNSHIGSLKRGAAMLPIDEIEHDLVFFGARSHSLRELVVEGRALVPTSEIVANAIAFTSGGEMKIDVDHYDAFLLYGMEARPFLPPEDHFYSSAVIARTLKDLFEGTLSHATLLKLRAITDKPIYLGHNPMKAAPRTSGSQSTKPYERGLTMLNDAIYSPMGAALLPQPLETVVNGNASNIIYSQGSKSLAIGDGHDDALHPDMDLNHMNDEFGSMWLRDWFAKLA
ncbi:hypothetical protein J3E64_002350 [Sphingobium sp. OAS761]|uniref:hypothetical protein n=1 Tax=Sphingobium sp. OAS761 TaxID=2817901 RepID=UPI00209FD398|nr:hypothetical protein [Sphingobium sp. OAS761]MCP1470662.1 hypothetical protein [Sphingobium sp. OAS761]